MDPNNLLAQQQAMVSQAMQNYHDWFLVMAVVQIGLMLLGAWVIYMFYARLRDIAEELMKLRVAYQFASQSKPAAPVRTADKPLSSGDASYQPK